MARFVRSFLLMVLLAGLTLSHAYAAEGGGANPDGPVFVKMQPISFSVIGPDNRIQKEIQMLVNLELEKGKAEALLDPYKRKLQDAFLVSMSEMWDAQPAGAPPIPGEDLKAKLLQVATDTAGPGIIKSVLLLGIGERSHVR